MNKGTQVDMPILVTGANGLIGYAVAAELAGAGRPVIGLVRQEPTEPVPFDLCFGDLTDVHRLHKLFTEHSFAAVIHCGGVSGPMVGLDNPFTTIATNILGTANILEACRIHGVERVVYTSSTTAYGNTPEAPVKEAAPLRPKDIYGATKAAGEVLVGAYSDQHGLDGVSLRISWVYGPRRRTDCLIRTLIDDALSGRPTRLGFGVGFHRQYVHVNDVVASILAAVDAPSYPSRVYNVTGGSFDSLDEVGAVVQRVLPQARIEMMPGPDPVDTMQEEFDISSIRQDLGFSPAIGLEEGIRAYAGWLQSRRAGQADL
jgi:UDP-glucuronate 4-epimerase